MPSGGNFTNCGCGPDAEVCDSPTQPVATVGLCLADGTPIAVTVVRDCAGATMSEGWLNLTTGVFSPGAPPAGVQACGDASAFELAGVLCDTDPATGDVLGLVLLQYAYNSDGSLASVTLLDAATGQPYTLQGELRHCPAGIEQPEQDVLELCDTAADGTVTAFLRDFRRDESGAIVGHSDYTLDGQPYTPAGTVDRCGTPCRHCQTHILCDVDPADLESVPQMTAVSTLPNGVRYAVTGHILSFGEPWWVNSTPTQMWEFSEPVRAEWSARVARAGDCYVMPEGTVAGTIAPEHSWDPDTRTLCATTSNTAATSTFSHPGAASLEFTAPEPTPYNTRRVGLMAVAPERVPFARTLCRDCDGQVVEVTDTGLDGTTPYTPSGTVSVCQPAPEDPEPCRDATTLMVCDLPQDGEPDPTVTDTPPGPYETQAGTEAVAGGAAALWSGGTLTIPADTAPPPDGSPQFLRTVAATVQAPRPGCDTGTATVTATLRAERTGPDPACLGSGYMQLLAGGTAVDSASVVESTPVGNVETLTLTAQVPAADLAAGNVALYGVWETYQIGASCPDGTNADGAQVGGWTLDQFTADVVYDQAGCETQFLRTVTVDCETGQVVSTHDTTMDGQPYTPAGEIGQCTAAGGSTPPEPCRDTSTLLLCDLPSEGEHDGAPTATDDTASLTYNPGPGHTPLPGGAPPLWAGDPFTIPSDSDGSAGSGDQVYRMVSARLTPSAAVPDCNDGTVTVTAAMDVTNDGPAAGGGYSGRLLLLSGGAQVDEDPLTSSSPVGVTQHRTVTAQVPLTEFEAGAVEIILMVETWQSQPKSWTAENFTASYEIGQPPEGCQPQFLRTIVTDCESGQIVSSTDTTLDGQPYTPTGEVGQCVPAGGGGECCPPPEPCPAQSVIEACRCDDTDGDGAADTEYVELLGVDCDGVLTSLGTYTPDLSGPYTPVAPVECGTGGGEAPSVAVVQARRVQLDPGAVWDAASVPLLQSVTATAHGGTGTITTADGDSTLFTGESVTWSVVRDGDTSLTGPLVIAADTGTVTVAFTRATTP
ncbi:hypothetical protein F0L17_14420 [Streptomyces sp. TRM43335]|uniref:Uncharacterized protein n=1 Tax=Streptomyces taklimakanensis TaxID=2569853 RepID=A0A6G2BEE9_9ACTN|nr:hypothetical protein [Streptomyces taklimakanensis]MTE20282.1 hypothetical protein [Streptomyces taklimakanensis]